MSKRYLSIWFPYLIADQFIIKNPALKDQAFAMVAQERNKQMIVHISAAAQQLGLRTAMSLADARILLPDLQAFKHQVQKEIKLLQALAEWCIRYTPYVALNAHNGLFLDISGCTHLWKSEAQYLNTIKQRLQEAGYHVKLAIADTLSVAWAVARFSALEIVPSKAQKQALLDLPAAALQLEEATLQRLTKLGLHTIAHFINIAPSTLRRRFGNDINVRLAQALGTAPEAFLAITEPHPYTERLQCLEPISTAKGIEIAIQNLLEQLCLRLQKDDLGIRNAQLKCYRLDGKLQQITIGTNQASVNQQHLFKLFELKIKQIAPGLGIELFVMDAYKVEELRKQQETLWQNENQTDINEIAELLDRIQIKAGKNAIRRYFPQEQHWPENSIKAVNDLKLQPETEWPTHKPRPTVLLNTPEPIQVSAPIPDYPPMNFIYKEEVHRIVKADGPERIEQEWWLNEGKHRDYYQVEDEKGQRYWLFRLGHYDTAKPAKWFIHGFFA